MLRFAVAVPPLPGMLFHHLPLWLTPHFPLVSLNCHIIGDALPQLTQRPVETRNLPSHTLHSPLRCLAFPVALTVSQEIPSLLVAFLPPWIVSSLGAGIWVLFFFFHCCIIKAWSVLKNMFCWQKYKKTDEKETTVILLAIKED